MQQRCNGLTVSSFDLPPARLERIVLKPEVIQTGRGAISTGKSACRKRSSPLPPLLRDGLLGNYSGAEIAFEDFAQGWCSATGGPRLHRNPNPTLAASD
jgi:hypothetical protein